MKQKRKSLNYFPFRGEWFKKVQYIQTMEIWTEVKNDSIQALCITRDIGLKKNDTEDISTVVSTI